VLGRASEEAGWGASRRLGMLNVVVASFASSHQPHGYQPEFRPNFRNVSRIRSSGVREKSVASYYSGATADAELPFRISGKRAFHNVCPINGD
jgi:hypothetical protein